MPIGRAWRATLNSWNGLRFAFRSERTFREEVTALVLALPLAWHPRNRNALIVIAGRAYDSLQGSLRELTVLRDTAIPKSREAAEAIAEGYGQGRFTLLEVLDAQASVAQARLRELEAQQNFHIAVATIEGLVGNPFALARESTR